MELKSYFFDTYALYEVIQGNKNYSKYVTRVGIITTKLNLMELYYGLLKDFGAETADQYYDYFMQYCVNFSDEAIKAAMTIKIKNRKLSYVDCIGYTIAKQFNIPFLTGDKEFKDMENVEYKK